MTVALQPPARTELTSSGDQRRAVPAVFSLRSGHAPEDPDHCTAAIVWTALAPLLTRSPYMRVAEWCPVKAKLIYPEDQPLTDGASLPAWPVALRLYVGEVCWALGLDFDVKGFTPEIVHGHAEAAARFFSQLGGRPIVDVAPGGGRHVWVPLAVPITLQQAQQLMHACRQMWPSLDTSVMLSPKGGCLTGPGSRGKHGGFRTLVTPLPEAVEAATRRSAPELVDRAMDRLGVLGHGPEPAEDVDLDATAVLGGCRPLSPDQVEIAERGTWDPNRKDYLDRPWSRSEPCHFVLCAAARRGYSGQDVLDRMLDGRWPGLLQLFTSRYRYQWRRRFAEEWSRAVVFVRSSMGAPQEDQITGGTTTDSTANDHVRRWLAIMGHLVDHVATGRARHSMYALLNGLAWLAWRTRRRHAEAGNRSYARSCAGLLDHTTVGAVLRLVRNLPPGLRPVWLRSAGRGVHGDLYELVIPPAFAHLETNPAQWPTPRPIPGVFGVHAPGKARARLLGISGWRLYQVLADGVVGTTAQLARAAGISRSEAYNVLPVLQRLGLARRDDGTDWQQGETSPTEAGEVVDAPEHLARLDERHTRERIAWRRALAAFAARREAAISHVPDDPLGADILWWPPDWADREPPDTDNAPPEPAGWTPDGRPLLDKEVHAIELLVAAFGAQLVA